MRTEALIAEEARVRGGRRARPRGGREARGGREVRPRGGKEGRDCREVRPWGCREVKLREAGRRGRGAAAKRRAAVM